MEEWRALGEEVGSAGSFGFMNQEITFHDAAFEDAAKKLSALMGKPLKGKKLNQLRESLRAIPSLWRVAGDLSRDVRLEALRSIAQDSAKYESVLAGLEEMRKGLEGEGCNEVERMAVEQVLTCWLQVCLTGLQMENCLSREHGLKEGAYWERRYHFAHLRLTRALGLLAQMRRLRIPGGDGVLTIVVQRE